MTKDICNRNNLLALIGALLLFSSMGTAQNSGELKVYLWDSLTRQPITLASVLLANTTIGDPGSNEGYGTYALSNIPKGKYDLTIFSAGYQFRRIPVELNGDQRTANILLVPGLEMLKDDAINPNLPEYHRLTKYFIRAVIGETKNSRKCEIINLQDIEFRLSDGGTTLIASSHKPITIINEALGYRILCWLQGVRINFKPDDNGPFPAFSRFLEPRISFGALWFAELPPKNNAQVRQWNKERARAYHGSIPHFMVSLRSGTLLENKFEVQEDPSKTSLPHLSVTYTGEPPEQTLPGAWKVTGPQTTAIKFLKPNLVVYENGYYDNPESYIIYGYMRFTQNIADLVPLNYRP